MGKTEKSRDRNSMIAKLDAGIENNCLEDVEMFSQSYGKQRELLQNEIFDAVIKYSEEIRSIQTKMVESKNDLASLFQILQRVRASISLSDKELKRTFEDIRSLDNAKKNLCKLINMVSTVDSLELIFNKLQKTYEASLALASNCKIETECDHKRKLFAEAAKHASATNDFFLKLKMPGARIKRIDDLKSNYEKIANFYVDQVYEDFGKFKAILKRDYCLNQRADINALLRTECELLEALSGYLTETGDSKTHLIDWVIDMHLQNFIQTTLSDCSTLEVKDITSNLTTYQRIIHEYNANYGQVFPANWDVPFAITDSFFSAMCKRYKEIVESEVTKMDIEDYVRILSIFISLEKEIFSHFQKRIKTPISDVFFAHAPKYFLHEKSKLRKIVAAVKSLTPEEITESRNKTLNRVAQVDALFLHIKKSFDVCSQLKEHKIFSPIIAEYKASFYDLSQALKCIVTSQKKGSEKELLVLCLIIKTCLYIQKLIADLQAKIVENYENLFNEKRSIDFGDEILFFKSLENRALDKISELVVHKAKPLLLQMRTPAYTTQFILGDPGEYVQSLSQIFSAAFAFLQQNCPFDHYIVLCGRFCDVFSREYRNVLFSCRNLCKTGAQQLLLDMYCIKSNMIGSLLPAKGVSSRRVIKTKAACKVAELEGLLKLLSAEKFPVGTFVVLFPAGNEDGLRKLLNVKYGDKKVIEELIAEYRALNND